MSDLWIFALYRAQFLFSDDEDEDTKRVVRSQKDKRYNIIMFKNMFKN